MWGVFLASIIDGRANWRKIMVPCEFHQDGDVSGGGIVRLEGSAMRGNQWIGMGCAVWESAWWCV